MKTILIILAMSIILLTPTAGNLYASNDCGNQQPCVCWHTGKATPCRVTFERYGTKWVAARTCN